MVKPTARWLGVPTRLLLEVVAIPDTDDCSGASSVAAALARAATSGPMPFLRLAAAADLPLPLWLATAAA